MISKIEVSKILDLTISKQTHYYTLWGGYTAVQFATGTFGLGHPLAPGLGFAVLFAVWAFNFGHLGFVLQCIDQLNKLDDALRAALVDDRQRYEDAIRSAFTDIHEGVFFWKRIGAATGVRSYRWNIFIHFFIDTGASLSIIMRLDNCWVQQHLPSFMRAAEGVTRCGL